MILVTNIDMVLVMILVAEPDDVCAYLTRMTGCEVVGVYLPSMTERDDVGVFLKSIIIVTRPNSCYGSCYDSCCNTCHDS